MIILLTIVHVIVCVFLVGVVLLQSGKAADIAGAFGGIGSQTTFGPRGAATALSKATTIAAGLFMVTSLTLAVLQTRQGAGGATSTVLDKVQTSTPPATKQGAPAGQQGIPVQMPTAPGQSSAPIQIPVGTAPAAPAKK